MDANELAQWIAATVYRGTRPAVSLVVNAHALSALQRLATDIGGDFAAARIKQQLASYESTAGLTTILGTKSAGAGYVIGNNSAIWLADETAALLVLSAASLPSADALKQTLRPLLFSQHVPTVFADLMLHGVLIPRRFVEWLLMDVPRPPLICAGDKALQFAMQHLPPGLTTNYAELFSRIPRDGLFSMLKSRDATTREFELARLRPFRHIFVNSASLEELLNWSIRDDILALQRQLRGTNVIIHTTEAVGGRASNNGFFWLTADDFANDQQCLSVPAIPRTVCASGGSVQDQVKRGVARIRAPMNGESKREAVQHMAYLQALAVRPLARDLCR